MKNTNIIKIIVFCLTVSLTCSCSKPRIDWNSINWEIWNDVATISAAFSDKSCQDEGNTGRTIKVYGYIPRFAEYDMFQFYDSPELSDNTINSSIHIKIISSEDSINLKLDTCDLSKKCYIIGELVVLSLHMQMSCKTLAVVHLRSKDDIWFE